MNDVDAINVQRRRPAPAAGAAWRVSARAPSPGGYGRVLALALIAGAALLMAQLLLLHRMHPAPYEVQVGRWPDQLFVSGFYEREGRGEQRYRWTTAGSALLLRQVGSSDGAMLALRLGETPPDAPAPRLDLAFGGRAFAGFPTSYGPRTYRVLVPRWGTSGGDLVVGLGGSLFSTANDPRQLGVRLDHASLDFAARFPVLPSARQALEQWALLGLCALTLRRLRWSVGACGAAIGLVACGLLLVYGRHLTLLDHYMARLLVGAALLAALAWWLPGLLARRAAWAGPPSFLRQLTALLVLGCALRLAGGLFPLFGAHDLPRNIGRLLLVHGGELVITARSAEFGSGFTVYPPAPYVVLLPAGLLIGDPGVLVQGGLALLDGTSALLVGLLARRVGMRRRAALLAALAYVALPISLTGLWWGFTAQTFGQWLMTPLALLLLLAFERPQARLWVGAGVLLSAALLSHIGVAILAVAWVGLALAALRWPGGLPWRTWRPYAAVVAAGCATGFLLIYLDVVATKIAEALKIADKVAAEPFGASYSLIWKGLLISYSPVGLALIPLGLALLWPRIAPPARALLGSWVAAALLFFGVELLSGLQVRYIYFFMPMGCLALGLLLDRLAARGRWGTRAAYGLAALLVTQGALLWYSGTFEGIKMSITPLSH